MNSLRKRLPFVQEDKTSKVQQHQAEAVNINTMVSNLLKHGQTGHPGQSTTRKPIYLDNTQQSSFQEILNIVKDGETVFNELPAKIRSYFKNQVGLYVDFMNNSDNLEKARELGLIEPAPEPKPIPVGTKTVPTETPKKEKTKEKSEAP